MSSLFMMEINSNKLCCSGELNCRTLPDAWNKYKKLSLDIQYIDVTELIRTDSIGLSFLTYLCIKHNAKLKSVVPQLQTLIELYDLEPVIL